MINKTPCMPIFNYLPFRLVTDGAIGYLYGTISQGNARLTMVIFAVRQLADTLLYLLANTLLEGKNLESHKIYIGTSAAVNMAFLILVRELNLVGRFFTFVYGVVIVGYLLHRVRYIQEQDQSPPSGSSITHV